MKDKLKEYIKLNYEDINFKAKRFMASPLCGESVAIESYTKNIKIDDYLKDNDKYNDFQTMLFKLIDERNLKDSDVYNKVNIDRRLFSKIRSDKNYHPSKETVILLGFSLELSELEIVELLDSASYSLPKNNYFDLIIRFCFINKIYNINNVNELLYDYDCKLLNV